MGSGATAVCLGSRVGAILGDCWVQSHMTVSGSFLQIERGAKFLRYLLSPHLCINGPSRLGHDLRAPRRGANAGICIGLSDPPEGATCSDVAGANSRQKFSAVG